MTPPPLKWIRTQPARPPFIDVISLYNIKNKTNNQILILWCLTMIDPATRWFETKN